MNTTIYRFSRKGIVRCVLTIVSGYTLSLLMAMDAHAQVGPIQFHYDNSGFQNEASTVYTWDATEGEIFDVILSSPRYNRENEVSIGTMFNKNQLVDLKEILDMIPRKPSFRGNDIPETGWNPNDPANQPTCGNGTNVAGNYGSLRVNFKLPQINLNTAGTVFGVGLVDCNNALEPVIEAKVTGKIGFSTDAPAAYYHFKHTDMLVGESSGMQFKIENESIKVLNSGADAFKVTKTGKVYAREFEVTLSSFPDYVFDKGYKLLPLSEVDEYIQRHKHLPGMMTAEEYENRGTVNVGELQLKLVEKIEELTLHVIAQEKKIEELTRKLEEKK